MLNKIKALLGAGVPDPGRFEGDGNFSWYWGHGAEPECMWGGFKTRRAALADAFESAVPGEEVSVCYADKQIPDLNLFQEDNIWEEFVNKNDDCWGFEDGPPDDEPSSAQLSELKEDLEQAFAKWRRKHSLGEVFNFGRTMRHSERVIVKGPWWAEWIAKRRQPDFVIGEDDPYLQRWHLIPRNPFFNIYLHQILRDDDDRALHDHPWDSCSIVLRGGYSEVTESGVKRWEKGSVIFRKAEALHRLAVGRVPALTLFITLWKRREWGFMCPGKGWVHWEEFVDPGNHGEIGKGCGE